MSSTVSSTATNIISNTSGPTPYIYAFYTFIYTSLILFIMSFFTSSYTYIGSIICADASLSVALIIIMVDILYNLFNKTIDRVSSQNMLFNVISSIGPFLFIFVILAFSVYYMVSFRERILNGQVSPSYMTFNNMSTILIIIQTLILFNAVTNKTYRQTGKISKITASLLYLVSLINTICLYTIFIVLNYYVTDGMDIMNMMKQS
jgi:hypothetical protein